MDLYDLLLEAKIMGCKTCNVHPNSENIKREKFYKKLITSINEKAFICSYIAGQVLHAYESDLQDRARALFQNQNTINLLDQVIKNSDQKDIWNHFCKEIGNKFSLEKATMSLSVIKILKIQLFCLINCQKIILPIMIKGCHHLECYEFTNLLTLCQENALKQFPQKKRRCFHPSCDNQLPLELEALKSKMLFPQQLAETISKEYSFSLQLTWDYNTNSFTFSKDSLQDNFILRDFQNLLKHDQNHIYIFGSYRKIINKELPEDLSYKLKFSSYKVATKGISYPVRCKYCPLDKCLDLKDFMFSEIKQMNKNRYSCILIFVCPACNHEFQDYKQLANIVYFDPYLAKYLSQNTKTEEFEQNKFEEFQEYFCQQQNLTFRQVKEQYLKEQINPYQNQHCTIDLSHTLKDPVVVLPQCKNKRAFLFSNFQTYCQDNGFSFAGLANSYPCQCEFCMNRKFKFNDFYYDEFYGQLLSLYNRNWQKNIGEVLQKHFQNDNNFDKPELMNSQTIPAQTPIQIKKFGTPPPNSNYQSQQGPFQQNPIIQQQFIHCQQNNIIQQPQQFQQQKPMHNNFFHQISEGDLLLKRQYHRIPNYQDFYQNRQNTEVSEQTTDRTVQRRYSNHKSDSNCQTPKHISVLVMDRIDGKIQVVQKK